MPRLFARLPVLSLLSALLLVAAVATPAFADEWAVGYGYPDPAAYGAYAYIETADPIVRDGGWSYMRVAVELNAPPHYANIKMGWINQPSAGLVQRPYAVMKRSSDGWVIWDAHPSTATCCYGYNYQVSKSNTLPLGRWVVYFDDLGTPWNNYWPEMAYGDSWDSGGQVSSASNGMGTSGNLYVQYQTSAEGPWVEARGWSTFITNSAYDVIPMDDEFSWQVSGNN